MISEGTRLEFQFRNWCWNWAFGSIVPAPRGVLETGTALSAPENPFERHRRKATKRLTPCPAWCDTGLVVLYITKPSPGTPPVRYDLREQRAAAEHHHNH